VLIFFQQDDWASKRGVYPGPPLNERFQTLFSGAVADVAKQSQVFLVEGTMKQTLLYFVCIVALVSVYFGLVLAETGKETGEICFYKAVLYQDMSSNSEYVKATTTDFAFPTNATFFLESGGFVKKNPDLILKAADIATIDIVRETHGDPIYKYLKDNSPHTLAPGPNLIINFRLINSAVNKFLEFTQQNVRSYFAIKINNQIFAVPHFIEPVGKELSLHLSGISTDEIKAKLFSLKKDIIVKDSEVK
jgi:hypothetical protein